jgi:hypothetical protein
MWTAPVTSQVSPRGCPLPNACCGWPLLALRSLRCQPEKSLDNFILRLMTYLHVTGFLSCFRRLRKTHGTVNWSSALATKRVRVAIANRISVRRRRPVEIFSLAYSGHLMVNGLCRLLLYERGLLYSRRYPLTHALNLDSGSARGNEGLIEMRDEGSDEKKMEVRAGVYLFLRWASYDFTAKLICPLHYGIKSFLRTPPLPHHLLVVKRLLQRWEQEWENNPNLQYVCTPQLSVRIKQKDQQGKIPRIQPNFLSLVQKIFSYLRRSFLS